MAEFGDTITESFEVGQFYDDASIASVEFVKEYLGLDAKEVLLNPLSGAGGLAAVMQKLSVQLEDESTQTFILKRTPQASLAQAKNLGQPREAFFYTKFSAEMIYNLPQVVYAHGNMNTGAKALLMNDLSNSIQSGYYYGPYSPHNWGKDLSSITGIADEAGRIELMETISLIAFRTAAKMHGKYWKDASLSQFKWLRGWDRIESKGEADWKVAQKTCVDYWTATKVKIAAGESMVRWNSHLVECMDASFAKISWENYCAEFEEGGRVFTLVHGDFHPANLMWTPSKEPDAENPGHLTILDWEVVGIGSGPQDIAQYFISHMVAAERRVCEDRLLKAYYDELILAGVDPSEYAWERCKSDYVAGGVCRWVWLLALLSGICPDSLTQYFQDQVSDFILDHGVTPETIGMPRV